MRIRTSLPIAFLPLMLACSSSSPDAAAHSPSPVSSSADGGAPSEDAGAAKLEPTDRQKQQAASVGKYLDELASRTGWAEPLALDPIKAREAKTILNGDGSDSVFYGAMWRALHAVPQGHQGLQSRDCGTKSFPFQHSSRHGVCARPGDDGLVVTFAKASNALGLRTGDRIVAVDGARGDAIHEAAAARAVCGAYFPSAAARRTSTAASFFATVPDGATLTIAPAGGGSERTVTVPSGGSSVTDCTEPLGRDIAFDAKATRRADGTAVIRLPRFYPLDGGPPPTTDAEVEKLIAEFQATIQAEFDKVKDAPRLIWDARGNGGGITPVAMQIVSGMPSARTMDLSYCRARIEGSSPPAFDAQKYAEYTITKGGPFSYSGKVAVIIDGLDYSASDYFAFAVAHATDVPLVGEETAGAFGGGGALFDVAGPPALSAGFDPNRCFYAKDDSPLEGRGTKPTHPVTYAPADLAAGIDTVLEAAVKLLAD